MDYSHDRARSLACLKRAVALMGQHAAVLDPVSYAVFYDYAAGGSPALAQALDERIARGALLEPAALRELFVRHLAPPEGDEALDGLNRVMSLLQAVSQSTAVARQASDDLGRSLTTFAVQLADAPAPPAIDAAVGELRSASEQSGASIRSAAGLLAQQTEEVERLRGELELARQEAAIDGLTQVLNRRSLDRALRDCVANAAAAADGAVAPCLLLLDVDHFKQINDRWGHAFGDDVLRALARALTAVASADDRVARYGGDEFALLVCGPAAATARDLAARLCTVVAGSKIRSGDGCEVRGEVTISIGAAAWQQGDDVVCWLQRADAALYAAKHAGRSCVRWAD